MKYIRIAQREYIEIVFNCAIYLLKIQNTFGKVHFNGATRRSVQTKPAVNMCQTNIYVENIYLHINLGCCDVFVKIRKYICLYSKEYFKEAQSVQTKPAADRCQMWKIY